MLFNEFCNYNNGEYVNFIREKYGENIFNWITLRFYNFVILYELEAFNRLFKVTIMECDILLRQIKNTDSKLDDLLTGTTSTSSVNTSNTTNSTSNNSYAGYNVEGDFNKVKGSVESQGTTNGTNTTISTLDELIKILQNDLTTFYNKLYDKLIPLFVTIN